MLGTFSDELHPSVSAVPMLEPGWLVPYPVGKPILGANIDTRIFVEIYYMGKLCPWSIYMYEKVVSLEGFFFVCASRICALNTEES